MSTRPSEQAKHHAIALAELLAEADGHAILRHMASMGLFSGAAASSEAQPRATTPAESAQIGIWEPDPESEGGWRRSEARRQEWSVWAATERIPAKGERRRVVLIGESVAYGWFHAPVFTPAKVLGRILDAATVDDPRGVEVIDLSRINLQLYHAVEHASAAARWLEPDVLVLFFGNNWHPLELLPNLAQPSYAEVLAAGGPRALIDQRREQLRAVIRGLLDRLSAACAERRTPLLVVEPDFNFGDWRDQWYEPWLATGDNARWGELRHAAELALAAGELDRATTLARELIELDQGTSGVGSALLGECLGQAGDPEGARRAIEVGWDALFLNPNVSMPRCNRDARAVMHEWTAAAELSRVELPAVFADYLDGALPDRRMFLDYCHMSAEGTRVAMAAVADALLAQLGGEPRGYRAWLEHAGAPPPDVVMENRFACVVQNSALGQAGEQNELALRELASGAPALFRCLCAVHGHGSPVWMLREISELAESSRVLDQLVVPATGGESYIQLASPVFEQLTAIVDEQEPGAGARFYDALADELGSDRRPTDLLHPRHAERALFQRETGWFFRDTAVLAAYFLAPAAAYYRAYRGQSRFCFLARGAQRLAITYRIPHGHGAARVSLNGRVLVELEHGEAWRTQIVELDAEALVRERNWLTIEWPPLRAEGSAALARAAERIARGLVPELFAIHGELHALTLRPVVIG